MANVDRIAEMVQERAAERAIADPVFNRLYGAGDMTGAGTRFHTLAKEVARDLYASGQMPAGYNVVAERQLRQQGLRGHVQLDLYIESPAGLHEIDWKPDVIGGLDQKIVRRMDRHTEFITNRGREVRPFLSQESRSWRPLVDRLMAIRDRPR